MKKTKKTSNSKLPSFILDSDMKLLHLPLSNAEFKHLEIKILQVGPTEPIKIWNNLIIENYETYIICQKHNINFTTHHMPFSCKEQAMEWLCQKQLSNLAISKKYKMYLIGKRYLLGKIIYKNNFTASELGKIYGLTIKTIHNYTLFAQHIDYLQTIQPYIVTRILAGEFKLSFSELVELVNLPNSELNYYRCRLEAIPHNTVSYTQLHQNLCKSKNASYKRANKKSTTTYQNKSKIPEIKKMPEYDPDADISSLALTIPFWITSIQRTKRVTQIESTSSSARSQLIQQLYQLRYNIDSMINYTKGDKIND